LLLVCYPSELAMRQSGTHIAKTKDGYQIANHGIAALAQRGGSRSILLNSICRRKDAMFFERRVRPKLLLPSPEAVAECY
jgi:hypothetical protein